MSFTRTLGRRTRPSARVAAPASNRGSRQRRRIRASPRIRLAVVVALVAGGLLFGAWMWVRDSSLAAVSQVTITGETGPEAGAIRAALRAAARNMTTLDVQMGQLQSAVASFPQVRRLRVHTAFPHRMVIQVIEQRPVGILQVAGRAVPVAADGTILPAVVVSSALPAIPLSVFPGGRHLHEGRAADAVALLAAAPERLLSKISQVTMLSGHGLVAQLRNGPSLYFGDAARLRAKWAAATAVLGDPGSAGAAYIDVSDPSRPAAGAGVAAATGVTTSGTASAATSNTAAITTPLTPATSSGSQNPAANSTGG